ncbi:MAG: glutathione-disulfide reductase [Paracoccaceae bacterium]
MAFDYDLFVIGGGSGGVRAARIAASEGGAKVALAEESRMGGTCVIRGCVPKKLMVFASAFPEQMRDARAYGWSVDPGKFDWPAFRGTLHKELDRLEAAYRSGLVNAGVTIHDMRAVIEDAHTVRLADGRVFTTKHILVATGGWPFIPQIPGRELAVTSNEMFDLPALPARAVVVGGGFIACEFACILNGLGVAVTQVYRGGQILRGFDDEARGMVANAMAGHGVNILLNADVARLDRAAGGIAVTLRDGSVLETDLVLYATGRKPNTASLGLENLGLTLGRDGEIPVDGFSQTRVPSVYAVGDVTNRINLTPVAIREGHAFADTVFRGVPTRADHDLVPSAVFTQPELGTVGLTEEQAAARGPYEVYSASFRPMRSLFAGRDDRVLMKLIVDAENRRVLGCHIVGPEAGEMIQLAAIAVKMGATKEDFDRTVAVHPTMAEELVTMRKPARRG